MALSGKFVKIEHVLEKVYRDYKYQNIDVYDALEWAGEAIDLIGVDTGFVNKVTDGNTSIGHSTPVVIEDYRGEFPCDLYLFKTARRITDYDATEKTYAHAVALTEANESFHTSTPQNDSYSKDVLKYTRNANYIFVGFPDGYLEVEYLGFVTDDRGFPMIPDNVRYIKAISCYIAERISFGLYIQGKLSREIYDKINQEWLWYVKSAEGEGKLPTVDQMESFKEYYLRLIPRIDRHTNFFKDLDTQEQINII